MTNFYELMQRQSGVSLGPIQNHRLAMSEQFLSGIDKSSPGFKASIRRVFKWFLIGIQ